MEVESVGPDQGVVSKDWREMERYRGLSGATVEDGKRCGGQSEGASMDEGRGAIKRIYIVLMCSGI